MYASPLWERDRGSMTLSLFIDNCETVIWEDEFKLKIFGSMFQKYR